MKAIKAMNPTLSMTFWALVALSMGAFALPANGDVTTRATAIKSPLSVFLPTGVYGSRSDSGKKREIRIDEGVINTIIGDQAYKTEITKLQSYGEGKYSFFEFLSQERDFGIGICKKQKQATRCLLVHSTPNIEKAKKGKLMIREYRVDADGNLHHQGKVALNSASTVESARIDQMSDIIRDAHEIFAEDKSFLSSKPAKELLKMQGPSWKRTYSLQQQATPDAATAWPTTAPTSSQ